MTLADEIRALLRTAPGPLTAREVREQLDGELAAEAAAVRRQILINEACLSG